MKERLATFLVLLSLAAFAYSLPPRKDRPFYVDCLTSRECGKGQCCTIGMERYSSPHCQSLQKLGEMCRPVNDLITSANLTYPDGAKVAINNVYRILCPCKDRFTCSSTSGTCELRH
ncbi:astakine-like isoform X2 [Cimex lectularius]|uniref:Prokineticin domain-containing protein n=1 Tax=Cimex lectularius TaxID=79782 RepID=A0A8I6S1T8_CIMLE|nr:astakine-like isoform X2 [Cimex lectularius]